MALVADAAPAHRRGAVLARRLILVGLLVLLALAASLALLRSADGAALPARELVVTAQGAKFNATNPPIELKVGERVALTVVNRDAMPHDLVIAGLGARTKGYLQPGAQQTLVFVPGKPGVFTYGCTLHPGLMDGQIVVRQN
ncbi:MAG: cupredoxin domain-containing protein [Chloroflexi bacterium]|nr:cupredoxin domain-containing protein [Chloroflexota bacterium]MBI4504810.1 cupredoxin domain-containing protein [Chloroflexota bacterium]